MTKESDLPKEPQPRVVSSRGDVDDLKIELQNINRGIQTYFTRRRRRDGTLEPPRFRSRPLEPSRFGTRPSQPLRFGSGPLEPPTFGTRPSQPPRFRNGASEPPRFGIRGQEDTESDEDGEDNARSVLRCPSCDFEIDFSVVRTRLEELNCYDPKDMICPICDETLGEETTRVAPKSSSEKRAWKSDKSSISSGDSEGPSVRNVSDPNSSGIRAGEGSSSAKGYGTDASQDSGGDAQDIEERRQRASFVQELVSSTLI